MNEIMVATIKPGLTRAQIDGLFNHSTDERRMEVLSLGEGLSSAMEKLRPREQSIIRSIFFLGETEKDVAKRERVTPTRINQLKRHALHKLRYIMIGGM